ncbi:glycosyltransferase family 2 protein [Kineococcus auxinigenes]|uniref:glycosyltransferase n=1 Tax=unclassified Kineococcus TaxID=2621656 RepID=UPI003D7E23E9
MNTTGLRVAAVIPVRGHAALLDGCLESLRAQSMSLDEVIVVDDSPEGSLEQLPGVRVERSGGRGPYAARNTGWRSSGADVILFLDARSRPRPGWAERLVEAFTDPDVVLAGTGVEVSSGPSLAAQASHRAQFFKIRSFVSTPFFLPYLPTCNLAARRSALEAVDGFSGVRSGGDADLCWRVQRTTGGRLEGVEEVLMEWVPREKVLDLLEQTYRYGKSNHALRTEWSDRGAPPRVPLSLPRLAKRAGVVSLRLGLARLRGDAERSAALLADACGVATEIGYRVAVDRARRSSAPPTGRGAGRARARVGA